MLPCNGVGSLVRKLPRKRMIVGVDENLELHILDISIANRAVDQVAGIQIP